MNECCPEKCAGRCIDAEMSTVICFVISRTLCSQFILMLLLKILPVNTFDPFLYKIKQHDQSYSTMNLHMQNALQHCASTKT